MPQSGCTESVPGATLLRKAPLLPLLQKSHVFLQEHACVLPYRLAGRVGRLAVRLFVRLVPARARQAFPPFGATGPGYSQEKLLANVAQKSIVFFREHACVLPYQFAKKSHRVFTENACISHRAVWAGAIRMHEPSSLPEWSVSVERCRFPPQRKPRASIGATDKNPWAFWTAIVFEKRSSSR